MVRSEELLIGVQGVFEKCTANRCPESAAKKQGLAEGRDDADQGQNMRRWNPGEQADGEPTQAQAHSPHRILGRQCPSGGLLLWQGIRLFAGCLQWVGNGAAEANFVRAESGQGEFRSDYAYDAGRLGRGSHPKAWRWRPGYRARSGEPGSGVCRRVQPR